ncbi:probing oxygen channels in Melanocarpus Albomyces laccase [Biscogniauxia mediterranea]|nr:probing oxygen channels in Melanocarpus Albomyces laccase [Biscogniauxia mediterranea]
MRLSLSLLAAISEILFIGNVRAIPSPLAELTTHDSGSCNTASNRACWRDGFDIYTDYEIKTPPGKVKKFHLEVTEHDHWKGPDGRVKEKVMLINNQFPGPTLVADWGDTLEITVTNKLRTNGTSIHWHGIRQLKTNIQDGANGVTECPLPPGSSKKYTFRATQYGTTWYHSHFSAQYTDGVFGTIVINGPASLPYDIDLGPYPIFDYYLETAERIVLDTQSNPAAPPSDNVLFNGSNINPVGPGGQYSKVTLTPGKRHRLRLINPSSEHNFQVSIVGHDMTVIATDFVPVNSFTTNNVFLGIGQRVDVTIDASKPVGNYWMNVTMFAENLCGISNNPFPAAIIHYAGAPDHGNPTDPGTTPANTGCLDGQSFSPVVRRTAPLSAFHPGDGSDLNVTVDLPPSAAIVTWQVDNSSMRVDWGRPVLEYVLEGNRSYPRAENIVSVDARDAWSFWVIEDLTGIPHPVHLHGHDFVVAGRSGPGAGPFDAGRDAGALRADNPVRRDVTMLPPGGWVVLAFRTDNPGAWLFHCHIAWHVSGGFGVDFLERVDDQLAQISREDAAAFNGNCEAWRSYYARSPWKQIDSGL